MTTYTYPALLVKQTADSKPMLLLSAPAAEIEKWAGIPQKRMFSTAAGAKEEAIGFQREENANRIDKLGQFFSHHENVIQNPLLCATRIKDETILKFVTSDKSQEFVQTGELVISVPDYSKLPFGDLLGQVREYLESRMPEYKMVKPKESLIQALKKSAREDGYLEEEILDLNLEESEQEGSDDKNEEQIEASFASLFEESHISEFWEEIAARHEVAKLLPSSYSQDSFLGFSRDALAAYIFPIVLVDGQHRLKGALHAAKKRLLDPAIRQEVEERISNSEQPEVVENDIILRESRRLPISLLLSAEPAEQVFQFVVVNQKATPIPRALLGTIVSTTLSQKEMGQVEKRLKDAGIELDESKAVTFLAKFPSSPFFGKVDRGLSADGDSKEQLQWNVFSSLVNIFRDLKGGKLYGETNDYADVWRKKFLETSLIVSDYEAHNCASAFEYWKQLDGPWRDVFMTFWKKIKYFFGSEDPSAHNYWGSPRTSNLFNKPSLTILTADFFQFLIESRSTLEDVEQIPLLVDQWLEGVKPNYFNRDWNLKNTKKDLPGIRNAWAFAWKEYRKNPDVLPSTKNTYNTTK